MRTKKFRIAAYLLCACFVVSSCIGSFNLTQRILTWNRSISEDKFINELVFVALNIVLVYPVSVMADAVVLNSIEFWTGENPMIAQVGTTKQVKGADGNYWVKTLENGYHITKEGEEPALTLVYNAKESCWNVVYDGKTQPLVKKVHQGTAELYLGDGRSMSINLTQQGMMTARQMADIHPLWMAAK